MFIDPSIFHYATIGDKDMNLGAIIFGVFCVFVLGAGLFYVAGVSHNQPTYTDTYGNTLSEQTNSSINASEPTLVAGESSVVPLILIVGAVFVCCVVFLMWLVAKQFL